MLEVVKNNFINSRFLIVLIVALTIFVSWSGSIDLMARDYVDAATIQALAAFATARLINAIVTVAASIEVSVAVLSINPLEVLDPINDLVEQYATIMQVAVGSLVIQKILIEILSTSFFKWAVTASGLFLVLSMYLKSGAYSYAAMKVFLTAAMARFLIIFVVLVNGAVDRFFINQQTEENMTEIEVVAGDIQRESALLGVAKEEAEAVKAEITVMKDRIAAHEAMLADATESLSYQQGRIDAAKQELDTLEPGLFDRFASGSNKEERDRLRQDIRSSQSDVSRLEREIKRSSDVIAEAKRSITKHEEWLASGGNQTGWIASLRERAGQIRELTRMDGIVEKSEGLVKSMVNLMAIFFMKTLILPIVFLYFAVHGFRLIWGIDVRTYLPRAAGGSARETALAG